MERTLTIDLTIRSCPDCDGDGRIVMEEDQFSQRLWRVRCERCGKKGAGFYEDKRVSGYDAYKNIVTCWEMAKMAWNKG